METITKINEALKEVFKDSSFADYSYEDFNNCEDLMESLTEQINEEEIIYYARAIEYLSENDASLNESIGIAVNELGYSAENLNSEVLATVLYQQNLTEELSELRNEIESCFEELD